MKRPLSKQTKIQRYKQIEKEIEHDRRIRQDEMKIIEEKENKKKERHDGLVGAFRLAQDLKKYQFNNSNKKI